MKKKDVEIGATYVAKVSGKLARVRIDRESPHGGWEATNAETGRRVRIKSAQRLRFAACNGPARSARATRDAALADDDRQTAPIVDEAEGPGQADDGVSGDEPTPDAEETGADADAGCGRRAAHAADLAETIAETGAYPPPLDRIDGERLANDVKRQAADLDPDRCATPRCKREPAMTYLGKPLCQACWEAASQETTNAGAESAEKETDMSKKNASKKATTKTSKATKAPKSKKPLAAKPKAERKPAGDAKPKRLSALDAAAEILRKTGKPMRSQEMIAAMAEQGLWSSPAGKTPHATLYAAILREIGTKGGEARFHKADRGLFEYAG